MRASRRSLLAGERELRPPAPALRARGPRAGTVTISRQVATHKSCWFSEPETPGQAGCVLTAWPSEGGTHDARF